MKKNLLGLMAVVLIMTACESNPYMPYADPTEVVNKKVDITFNIDGDFTLTTAPITRALEADGKSMTDVWVLDYVGGTLQQQLHQTSSDADFGSPKLTLGIGTHHIYFVASRSTGATLNTTDKTLTFTKVLDTFWRDYELTISSGSTVGSQNVALDRIVTKLKLIFSDELPAETSTINVTPGSWYYGFNYTTGNPTAATLSAVTTYNIPANLIGTTGNAVSLFGFSTVSQWTTSVDVNCKTVGGDILGSASIASAPFVRNRTTEFTGPLFTSDGENTMTLNTEWLDSYQGQW